MSPCFKARNACSLVVVGWLCLSGCATTGASTSTSSPTSAYSDGDAKLFDDGVDFIGSVLALEGQWQVDWEAELRARTAAASTVAVVTVHTLTTHTDPRHSLTHRLFVKPVRVLAGSMDPEGLHLASDEASRGFRTVNSNLRKLASGRYLLYAKKFRSETGVEALHWHLSPASEEVVAATSRMLAAGSTASE